MYINLVRPSVLDQYQHARTATDSVLRMFYELELLTLRSMGFELCCSSSKQVANQNYRNKFKLLLTPNRVNKKCMNPLIPFPAMG